MKNLHILQQNIKYQKRLETEQDGLEFFNCQLVEMCDIIRQVHAIMGVKATNRVVNGESSTVTEDSGNNNDELTKNQVDVNKSNDDDNNDHFTSNADADNNNVLFQ